MPDYLAAARRHFSDGDHLAAVGRHVNASQLWAYGAECTMKAILLKLNLLKLDAKGKPLAKDHCKHINDPGDPLIAAFCAAMSGHVDYLLPAQTCWFMGWDINQRYEDGTAVAASHAAHSVDKQTFQTILHKAIENGHA